MECKKAAAALLCLLLLTGCGRKTVPLADLPEDYSVEDAKQDGCVVSEDGDVTCGQEVWAEFYETVSKGKAASVRLCSWFTLEGALEGLSPYADEDYLASLEETYPVLCMEDLVFDGKAFTFTAYENGELWGTETYSYLRRFVLDKEPSPLSHRSRYNLDPPIARYILTDNSEATYEELFNSQLSAKLEDHIPFHLVYSELIEKT